MNKPLLVFNGGEYQEDDIIIYGNKEGLTKLRDALSDFLGGSPTEFNVFQGKNEHHHVMIELATNDDFPSEFD